jgi:DNA/RNA endonuclease YhcR with UshA esterase domain
MDAERRGIGVKKRALFVLAFGLLVASAPVSAHHSFSAEYDSKKPVTLKGIVTKVDWMNPHVYFYLDIKDESGNITNWALEMGPPTLLQKTGWTRNTMKVGDEVVVEGTLAKDGSKQANARSVTMATTGKKLGAGSSEGNTQQQ